MCFGLNSSQYRKPIDCISFDNTSAPTVINPTFPIITNNEIRKNNKLVYTVETWFCVSNENNESQTKLYSITNSSTLLIEFGLDLIDN